MRLSVINQAIGKEDCYDAHLYQPSHHDLATSILTDTQRLPLPQGPHTMLIQQIKYYLIVDLQLYNASNWRLWQHIACLVSCSHQHLGPVV